MNSKNTIITIIIVIIITVIVVLAMTRDSVDDQIQVPDGVGIVDGDIPARNDAQIPPVDGDDRAVFCTMDAMQCPDGSWIGRTGPKCEFVCP